MPSQLLGSEGTSLQRIRSPACAAGCELCLVREISSDFLVVKVEAAAESDEPLPLMQQPLWIAPI
jgi:hypothetical protein